MHVHWHKVVIYRGNFAYMECRCGHRMASRVGRGLRPGPDQHWIKTGEFSLPPSEPPPKPSDAARAAIPVNSARLAAGCDLCDPVVNAEAAFAIYNLLECGEQQRFGEMVARGSVADPKTEALAAEHERLVEREKDLETRRSG